MFTAIKTSAFLRRLIHFIKIHQKRQQGLVVACHPALPDDGSRRFLVPWAGAARMGIRTSGYALASLSKDHLLNDLLWQGLNDR